MAAWQGLPFVFRFRVIPQTAVLNQDAIVVAASHSSAMGMSTLR